MSTLRWLRGWRGSYAYHHRNGPVPHTACHKASAFGHSYRWVETFAERRDNASVARDEDCAETRVRVRAERLPGSYGGGLPDRRDGIKAVRYGNCWKRHRGTQYRPVH